MVGRLVYPGLLNPLYIQTCAHTLVRRHTHTHTLKSRRVFFALFGIPFRRLLEHKTAGYYSSPWNHTPHALSLSHQLVFSFVLSVSLSLFLACTSIPLYLYLYLTLFLYLSVYITSWSERTWASPSCPPPVTTIKTFL